ncbi:SET domain-containing protein [Mytilinidion resinicola]|uniref:SET domain-containing protein n=1 Tax=Mytilinidion resinicola TaxID=574789 RepID=A0A6A6Z9U4_9PEZI|nr:SET domain-containing protein [Mytilinidion resinicola]KAF2817588.1 SET domain-containing protein [Mytilinidion resinicola]
MSSNAHNSGPTAHTLGPTPLNKATSPQLFTLQSIPGQGKGLVASRAITPGTLLISEAPLFAIPSAASERDLATHLRTLPKESQRAFLSLHNSRAGAGEPLSNIVRTNAYPLGPGSDLGGIFPLIARINHSCRPNAQHAWNGNEGEETVYAVREIKEGEQLSLSYHEGGPSSERRKALKEFFGFDCTCEMCGMLKDQIDISDERLRRAKTLDKAIGDARRVRMTPDAALKDCRELLRIYEEERVADLRVPRLYYDAFQICAMHSDKARAKVFAERSREARVMCEGEKSEEAEIMAALVKDPARFENFGTTKKWKLEKVPGGLDGIELEKWLWRET